MPRPCLVCCHLDRQSIEALITAGASDYEVGRRFNIERVSVGRHRRKHLIKPAQDRLAILSKDSEARRAREQLAIAAASDAPTPGQFVEAYFGLKAQAEKLERIEARLERMATLAEAGGSHNGVATLAAQQLRGIETGARLTGLPGFTPAAQVGGSPGVRPVFSVNILFSSGRQETIAVTAVPGVIDDHLEPDDPDDGQHR
jgi:hypothetical protein